MGRIYGIYWPNQVGENKKQGLKGRNQKKKA
jgi:hypothetical protein